MKIFRSIRFLGLSFLLLAPLAFFSSCSDDDPTPNRIVIDGRGLGLDKGYIQDNGTSTDDDGIEGRVYTVFLFGPGLDFNADGDPEGEGDVVLLNLFSTSTDELADGTYNISDEDLVGIFLSQIYENYSVDDDDADAQYISNSGSIAVKKSGTKYTFTFKYRVYFENSEGNPDAADVRGQFSGSLTPIED